MQLVDFVQASAHVSEADTGASAPSHKPEILLDQRVRLAVQVEHRHAELDDRIPSLTQIVAHLYNPHPRIVAPITIHPNMM